MEKRHTRIRRKPRGAVAIPLAAILIVGLLGSVAYGSGRLNPYICDGPCAAEFVLPPSEIGPVDSPATTGPARAKVSALDPVKVGAAVRAALAAKSLGTSVGFVALDLDTGVRLAAEGSSALTPASTTKLLTAYAALTAIGPQTRFSTRVVSPAPGTIVLVGGGDPFLDSKKPKTAVYAHPARLSDLVAKTATRLKAAGTTSVVLGFDDSLFEGPPGSIRWPASYIADNIVTPISALWVDQGIDSNGLRTRTPALAAATQFAALLRKHGITVGTTVERTTVPATAAELARVDSATVAQILEATIQHSDNEAAEVMARHVAVAQGEPGSFDAATRAIADILAKHRIDTAGLQLFDGSGLSRDNTVAPLTLAQVVRAAATHAQAASLVADLPVAGFNGSMLRRFGAVTARAGRGLVLAKTGTLTGVHSYAGIVRDADGRLMTFALMADRTSDIPGAATEAALDDVAAALAACHCGAA